MNSRDLLVFDWDGVLYDSSQLYWKAYCQSEETLEYEKFLELFANKLKDNERLLPGRLAEHEALHSHGELYSDVAEFLYRLPSYSCEIALVTNSPLELLAPKLEKCGLENCFNHIFTSDQEVRKPNAQLWSEKYLNAKQFDRVIYCGDTAEDIAFAQALPGVIFVVCKYGYSDEDYLAQELERTSIQDAHVAHTPNELCETLTSLLSQQVSTELGDMR